MSRTPIDRGRSQRLAGRSAVCALGGDQGRAVRQRLRLRGRAVLFQFTGLAERLDRVRESEQQPNGHSGVPVTPLLRLQSAFSSTDTFVSSGISIITFNRDGYAAASPTARSSPCMIRPATRRGLAAPPLRERRGHHRAVRRHQQRSDLHVSSPESKRPPCAREQGFTLVEVLVALLVTAVGLLGIAKIQALAYASTGSASVRSLVRCKREARREHARQSQLLGRGFAPIPITITGRPSTVAI